MLLRTATAALAALVIAHSIPSAALASQAKPTGITGAWSGLLVVMKDGQVVDDDPIYLVLKHEGAVVTGTAGPNAERQFPIAKGKATTTSDGTTITFEVTAGTLVINFELKLVSGELKGSAVGDKDGEKQNATVSLQAVK